jgi:hypothetical protein
VNEIPQGADVIGQLFFENGKVVESQVIWDTLGQLKQLGATITPLAS